MSKQVAIKTIDVKDISNRREVECLQREIKAMIIAREHPNVVIFK